MAHDVFISYVLSDRTTADAVCAILEKNKIRCWVAPRDVQPGTAWAKAVVDAISESRLMVLILSSRSNESPQVMREVERAVHRGIAILPLRIEDVIPSGNMEYFLSATHWLDAMTPPLEAHLERLAAATKSLLSVATSNVQPAKSESHEPVKTVPQAQEEPGPPGAVALPHDARPQVDVSRSPGEEGRKPTSDVPGQTNDVLKTLDEIRARFSGSLRDRRAAARKLIPDILKSAGRCLERKGWKTRLTIIPDTPYFHIQVCRPQWPSTVGGIHYEARVTDDFLQKGDIDLNLHIEGHTPNQDRVCSRIRRLLRPYESQILTMCGTRLSDDDMEEILKGELPLTSLTPEGLVEAIERMTMAESFVDEALYLAVKRLVYRTDFLGSGWKPEIYFHGKRGGWEFCPSGGRFNSPSLRCCGNRFNWFNSKDTNILVLHPKGGFTDFRNGERVYISAIVRAPRGAQLQLVAQVCTEDEKWITMFEENPLLPETDLWQLVTAKGKLTPPEGYKVSRDGLFPYILVTAPKKDVWFSSIEIGRCR
jgi:hypothetical protein